METWLPETVARRLPGTTRVGLSQSPTTTTYGYDAAGKRATKSDGASTVLYIYAGPNCIAEYASATTAATPEVEFVYAQGIDSLVLIDDGSVELAVIRNQQWSVTALVNNSSGSVAERYSYDHFGSRTIYAANGTTVRNTSSHKNPYGYTSRRHDAETGLMYYRARYYDPETGEFISQDPLEYVDGMSQYRAYFVSGAVDPSGTATEYRPVVDGGPREVVKIQKWQTDWSDAWSSGTASGRAAGTAIIEDAALSVRGYSFYRGAYDSWSKSTYQPGKAVKATFLLIISCQENGDAKVNSRESVMKIKGGIIDTIGEVSAAVGYSFVYNGKAVTVTYTADAAWTRNGISLEFKPSVGANPKGFTISAGGGISKKQSVYSMEQLSESVTWECKKCPDE